MSIRTTHIEFLYDEKLELEGQQLWKEGQVRNLNRNEDGIYIAFVHDGQDYEVEVNAPFKKKQKVSCECEDFKSKSACKHIVAALFAIQDVLHEEKKKKVSKTEQKATSLNINHLVKEIQPYELIEFIKAYARVDKRFVIHLKAAFAHKVDLEDNIDKYRSILDAIVRPVTGKIPQVAASDIKFLSRILGEFADQINDHIALGHYRDGLNIFIACFSKLEYVHSKFNLSNEEIVQLRQSYYNILTYFLETKLPTELKRELQAFLIEFIQRSYYPFDSYQQNILFPLLPKLSSADKQALKPILLALLTTHPISEHAIILAFYLKITKKYTSEVLEYFEENPLQLMEVVNLLITDQENKIAKEILEKTYKSRPNDKDVMNRLLYLYIQEKNQEAFIALAKKAYLSKGENRYLELLKKELEEGSYEKVILEIEAYIHAHPIVANHIALNFFYFENNWAGMVIYLEKHPNIELLQKYDAFIFSQDQDIVAELYTKALDLYFSTQLGDTAHILAEKLTSHWRSNGMQKIIKKIHQSLMDTYQHRPELMKIFQT